MTVSILLGLALAAGAPEPVVWTKMVDPDPHYVAPKAAAPRSRPVAKAGPRRGAEPDNLEGAVVNLMKAASDAQDKAFRDYEQKLQRLENIAEVQKKMPNRNGMTLKHGLWDVKGTPDVHNVACMKNCPVQTVVSSFLPDIARGASGNLADQNRQFGPVRGVQTPAPGTPVSTAVTTKVAAASAPGNTTPAAQTPVATTAGQGVALLNQNSCVACHGMTNKIVGPGFNEVMAKYKGDAGAQARLEAKVKNGGSGAWGPIPMPPQTTIKDDDIKTMVRWILTGS